MNLDAHWVRETLGLQVPATGTFSGVNTDSRKSAPGELFVALKGDRFDGHSFVHQAVSDGATGILVSTPPTKPLPGVMVFLVPDTLKAYRRLAGQWRRKFQIPIFLIAGSVGKTTTKELLASLLEGRHGPHVLKTQGSQNGYIGIPMTLLQLRPEHHAAVVEVGIDAIGAMREHIELLSADAAIVTAVAEEHMEHLKDLATVAKEELTAFEGSPKLCAVNLDDPWISPVAVRIPRERLYGYSLRAAHEAPTPFNESRVLRGKIEGIDSLMLSGMGLDGLRLRCPLPGKHNLMNLLGACALARGIGLTGEEIQKGLSRFNSSGSTQTPGRNEIKKLPNGTTVLCDYYNANPASMTAAFETLSEMRANRRWACLGDMLELGPESDRMHAGLAKKLLDAKVDGVLLYGAQMRFLEESLAHSGFSGTCEHFQSHQDLAAALVPRLSPQDVVLLKGSRGMRMETVWAALNDRLKK